ncbi:MAG: type II secretion system protein [Acidobacteria bacterium]|nr:type II secretion system protein [Acidobacteriota bacterium]
MNLRVIFKTDVESAFTLRLRSGCPERQSRGSRTIFRLKPEATKHARPRGFRLPRPRGFRLQAEDVGLQRGYTFVELLIVTSIVLILASAVMPLARVTVQRTREAELRRVLREMRTAIDRYKDAVDQGLIGGTQVRVGSEGYPPDLETLVEGVPVQSDASGRTLKFLRRIPADPMTSSTDWGLRSYQDRPDATTWGGQNVFDVYTKSLGTALDGTKYRDW